MTSHGHDVAGIAPAQSFGDFIFRTENESDSPAVVKFMMDAAEFHMRHISVAHGANPRKTAMRMMNAMRIATIQDMAIIASADHSGRPFTGEIHTVPAMEAIVTASENVEIVNNRIKPMMNGAQIMAMGFPQGKIIGQIQRAMIEAQIEETVTDFISATQFVRDNFGA